jgi:branched-chain amino acid transport system permease protein
MDLFLTVVILGITTGLVYAIAGVGLVVIYRTSGYVSFAQGDIAAVALFTGYFTYRSGLPYPLMAVLVLVTGALLAGVLALVVITPLEKHGHLTGALATIGVGLCIQGIESMTVGTDQRPFPSVGEQSVMDLGPVDLTRADIASIVAAVLLFVGMTYWFGRSATGISMRAANDNPAAAVHVGVPARRLRLLSWVISGALAGLCGLFVAPLLTLTPVSVNTLLVFGFATVVVGGFESIPGAFLAGIIIGVVSNLVALYIDPGLVSFGIYVLVMLILVVRPHGLLGRKPLVRV